MLLCYPDNIMLNVLNIMPSLERMFWSLNFIPSCKSARVAQLVERQAFNLNVQGSSPCSGGTRFFSFWSETKWRLRIINNIHFHSNQTDFWNLTIFQMYTSFFVFGDNLYYFFSMAEFVCFWHFLSIVSTYDKN